VAAAAVKGQSRLLRITISLPIWSIRLMSSMSGSSTLSALVMRRGDAPWLV